MWLLSFMECILIDNSGVIVFEKAVGGFSQVFKAWPLEPRILSTGATNGLVGFPYQFDADNIVATLPSEFTTTPKRLEDLSAFFSLIVKWPVGVRRPSTPVATYVQPTGAPPLKRWAFCSLKLMRTEAGPLTPSPRQSNI